MIWYAYGYSYYTIMHAWDGNALNEIQIHITNVKKFRANTRMSSFLLICLLQIRKRYNMTDYNYNYNSILYCMTKHAYLLLFHIKFTLHSID